MIFFSKLEVFFGALEWVHYDSFHFLFQTKQQAVAFELNVQKMKTSVVVLVAFGAIGICALAGYLIYFINSSSQKQTSQSM